MRKTKQLLIALMAAVMLVSIIPAAYAADTDALNADSGKWSAFDESVYDTVTTVVNVKDDLFDWPSSGKVLLKVGSSTYTLKGSKPNCIGITIPAGLIVDIYKYNASEDTYTLLGHFDTTDGQSVTISEETSNNSSSSGNANVNSGDKPSTSTGNNSTNLDGLRAPKKVFVPGTPSKSYKNSYTDVPATHWAYHPIMTMTDGGLLAGYGNGKFGPDDTLTRAQVAIIYTRLLGQTPEGDGSRLGYKSYKDNTPATRAFAAIWYAGCLVESSCPTRNAAETAALLNAGGKDGGMLYRVTYKSNGEILDGSTWDHVYDIWYANQLAGKNIKAIQSVDELPDAAEIHKWINENCDLMRKVLLMPSNTDEQVIAACEQAICRAYNLGMIGGVDSKGTFAPYGELTRAQLCQMLYNIGFINAGVLAR